MTSATDLAELLAHWRTFPAPSNERLAVEIIEQIQSTPLWKRRKKT